MLNQVPIEQKFKHNSSILYANLKYLILLDYASAVYFFMNSDLASNIWESSLPLHLETNNRMNITTKQGTHGGLDA